MPTFFRYDIILIFVFPIPFLSSIKSLLKLKSSLFIDIDKLHSLDYEYRFFANFFLPIRYGTVNGGYFTLC